MKQLIIIQLPALDSFLKSTAPTESTLILLCAPTDLEEGQLSMLIEYSASTYWLHSKDQVLPFGQHANYDKWAELSVQCDRSFFWPV